MLKSLKEAATEIGVPYRTVYNRYVRGDIEVQRIGRTLAIDPEYLKDRIKTLGITSRGVKRGETNMLRVEPLVQTGQGRADEAGIDPYAACPRATHPTPRPPPDL